MKKSVQLHVVFPSLRVATKQGIVASIMDRLQTSGEIDVAGYKRDEDLERDLAFYIGAFNPARYKTLTRQEARKISEICESTVNRCVADLPHELPVQVFLFPWFPDTQTKAQFGGVNAVAVHEQVMHLYLVPGQYKKTALIETVAHEFTHLAYYHAHPARQYSLRAHIIMEGVAEVFREEVVGGSPAPWATALSKKECEQALEKLRPHLSSRSVQLHEHVLFGGGGYKQWTGYAVGYRLIQLYRQKNSSLAWSELIKKNPATFFDS